MESPRYLGHQIKLLSNAYEQAVNRNCELSGLTGSQAFLIAYLLKNQEKPIYAKTLEREFHLKHPTICGILQRLEGKGFITFSTDETDRRCRRIIPTAKAINTHLQATQRLDTVDRQIIHGFTQEEVDQFYSYLTRAVSNIDISCPPTNLKSQEDTL